MPNTQKDDILLPAHARTPEECQLVRRQGASCAIVGCTTAIVESIKLVKGKEVPTRMKTCSDTTHQEMEHLNSKQSKANFQLSQKLMHQKVAHPNDAMAEKRLIDLVDLEDAEEWFEVDAEDGRVQMFTINNPRATGKLDISVPAAQDPCPLKAETGNRKIKAQFGQCCTHNNGMGQTDWILLESVQGWMNRSVYNMESVSIWATRDP
jgi:hypothetical protein